MDKIEQLLGTLVTKMDTMSAQLSSMDEKFTAIDERFDAIDERFTAIDEKFASIDERFDTMDERITSLDGEMTKMRIGLENVTNKNIQLLLEGQAGMNDKFRRLDELEEKVEDIQITVSVLKALTLKN